MDMRCWEQRRRDFSPDKTTIFCEQDSLCTYMCQLARRRLTINLEGALRGGVFGQQARYRRSQSPDVLWLPQKSIDTRAQRVLLDIAR